MSKFKLPEVSANVDTHEFLRTYYLPRKPVVIRNIPINHSYIERLTPDAIRELLLDEGNGAVEDQWWWNISEDLLADCLDTPQIYKALRTELRFNQLDKSSRLWASSKDTASPWHYDGGSIEVFNLQLLGEKSFALIDPDTPLRCARFSVGSFRGYAGPSDQENWTEVTLQSGDMVYIPRHWFHRVNSLGDWNLNMNWTWTDPNVPFNTKCSRRELELTALLYYATRILDRLPKSVLSDSKLARIEYVKRYGGTKGFAMAKNLAKQTSFKQLLLCLINEMRTPSLKVLNTILREEELRLNDGVLRSADDYWKKSVLDEPDHAAR